MNPITDFPTTTISVSLWIRAASGSGGDGGDVLLSYVSPDSSPGDSDLLLHDLRDLHVLVHGAYVLASKRYDGPTGGDLGGIRTGINVARDQEWHHVAVAWRSSDGRVAAFLDGTRVFDGGPYKTGAELTAGGTLVLGQSQTKACALSYEGSLGKSTGCQKHASNGTVDGIGGPGGLMADAQHLRLWSTFVAADEVAQQMREPFEGNSVGQVKVETNDSTCTVVEKCTMRNEQRVLDTLMVKCSNIYTLGTAEVFLQARHPAYWLFLGPDALMLCSRC